MSKRGDFSIIISNLSYPLQIATSSYDKTIRLWDSETGKTVHVLKGHSGVVVTVSWSPDGTKLASGGADESVRIWDTKAGVQVRLEHLVRFP